MGDVLVVLIGIAVIAFIAWFFFGKREEGGEVRQDVEIIVDGGYRPATIRVPVGKPVKLHFLRRDSNTCLEEVILGDFRQRAFLPLNERVTIAITADRPGTYEFRCGMNMYHGKLIVEGNGHAH